jgi:hypothetical protein
MSRPCGEAAHSPLIFRRKNVLAGQIISSALAAFALLSSFF